MHASITARKTAITLRMPGIHAGPPSDVGHLYHSSSHPECAKQPAHHEQKYPQALSICSQNAANTAPILVPHPLVNMHQRETSSSVLRHHDNLVTILYRSSNLTVAQRYIPPLERFSCVTSLLLHPSRTSSQQCSSVQTSTFHLKLKNTPSSTSLHSLLPISSSNTTAE